MHSITKNLSKILALTTLFVNFTPVFAQKTKPKATRQPSHSAKPKPTTQTGSLIGTPKQCAACEAAFRHLNENLLGLIVFDSSLLDGTFAPAVLNFLTEFESLFADFQPFTLSLTLNRCCKNRPFTISLLNAQTTPDPRPGFKSFSCIDVPLENVKINVFGTDFRTLYTAARDSHTVAHFTTGQEINSAACHYFATIMLLLHTEEQLIRASDALEHAGGRPRPACAIPFSAAYRACAQTLWDRLVHRLPDLADPSSHLSTNLGTSRSSAPADFYPESLAELFAFARTSDLATEEVKQAVYEEFTSLFKDPSLYQAR